MALLAFLTLQTVVIVALSVWWYRLGMRAGFARGENHGIHYALGALRGLLDDETDPGPRTH